MVVKSILISLLFTNISFAQETEIKELMNNYLKAIHQKDSSKLKLITSPEYYKGLENSYLNSDIKQKKKFIPYGFDIKINKAYVDKNQYWVNIKDKKKEKYSDYWYIIEKKNKIYKISNMVHAEE